MPPPDVDVAAELREMRPRFGFGRLAIAAVAVGPVVGVALLLLAAGTAPRSPIGRLRH